MITIKEIAQHLGVSPTTVSNVVRGKTKEVSKENIEKIQNYLKEVNYIPNMTARNLAQQKSNIIGVVLKVRKERTTHIFTDPFVAEMLGGIEEVVRKAGYSMMVRISDDIEEILDYVTTWNVDGMILFCMLNDDAIRVQQQFKKPIACVDAYISKEVEDKFGDKFINIALDDEEGVYNCISYLIDNGHRKIGFYSDNIEGVNAARLRGYKRALMDHGIKPSKDDMFKFDPSVKMHDISLNKLIDKAKDYTAVFCTSDMYAVELMNGCILKGINVPDDLSIIGVDDTLISKVARPQLTTLHQSPKEKGKLAAVKIMEFINGENAEEHQIILKSHLVIRNSVKNIK